MCPYCELPSTDAHSTATIPAVTTPEKRKRGKCMSRRSQVGSIEKSGRWYVVRFRKDVSGKDNRLHASERICPITGPGSLTKAERKTKALEIVMSSGVNNPQQFEQSANGITFREQAELFIRQKTTSKRKPLKPATLCTWENCLDKWLNPNIGDIPLASINNGAMKHLVAKMVAAGLLAKTIVNYSGLVKLIVASAKNKDGEPLFPRKWDSEFIDLPIVRDQRQPTFNAETMSSIVQNAAGQFRALYALLGGSGLRIGEAFGLEIQNISDDCRTVCIRQSVWEGVKQSPKTPSAIREVDINPDLATMLKDLIGDRKSGFLFRNAVGKPLAQSNVLRRDLHPILTALGVPKAGFHSFRRFRATHLCKSRVPESLVKFWMGHSESNQTEEYVKLFDEAVYRKEVTDSIGIGFELSPEKAPIVRNVRRKQSKNEMEVAA